MTACTHHIWGGSEGVQCIRVDEHDTHVYHAASDDLGDHGAHCDEGGNGS